jgi:hypothetical protein
MHAVDEKEVKWLSLCDREENNRINLNAALQNSSTGHEFQALLREWWASIEALLNFYVEEVCLNMPPRVLPFGLVNAFKGLSGYLAVGNIPAPIADVVARGAHAPGPSEKRDIGVAVAYLMAAQGGIEHFGERIVIDDRAPVKTICEAFSVSRATAQGWRKKFKPDGLGMNPINAEILKSLMRQAGERYRLAGRSPLAIRNRRPSK